MGYLSEEMETHFYWVPCENEWRAWTNIPKWRDSFLKMGWTLKAVSRVNGEECDWTFAIKEKKPLRLLDMSKPKVKRELTEKQRAAFAKNWAKSREDDSDDKSIDEE